MRISDWSSDVCSSDLLSPTLSLVTPLSIPSPSNGVWYLGPVPLRGYALAIILGIVAAVWISERRWVARGGTRGELSISAERRVGKVCVRTCRSWYQPFH